MANTETHVPLFHTVADAPPYSRLIQLGAGTALVLAGLLNGLPQYLGEVLIGDLSFTEQIAWGTTHELAQRTEQVLMVLSSLFLVPGLLGLAQVTRWRAPRLTLVGVPLMLWGMWGFTNVLAMGYVAGTVAPPIVGTQDAIALNDALPGELGVIVTALAPHLVGSFFGVLLLTIAAWRSGLFPRVACAALVVFLIWDFLLPASGFLEPHLLLAIGWGWLGVTILRLPVEQWRGVRAR